MAGALQAAEDHIQHLKLQLATSKEEVALLQTKLKSVAQDKEALEAICVKLVLLTGLLTAGLASSLQAAEAHVQDLQLQLATSKEEVALLQTRLSAVAQDKQVVEADCDKLVAELSSLKQKLSSVRQSMTVYQSQELELQVTRICLPMLMTYA